MAICAVNTACYGEHLDTRPKKCIDIWSIRTELFRLLADTTSRSLTAESAKQDECDGKVIKVQRENARRERCSCAAKKRATRERV